MPEKFSEQLPEQLPKFSADEQQRMLVKIYDNTRKAKTT